MTNKPFLFIALFCLALYINSLGGEFIWDDQSFVFNNMYIRHLSNFVKFFTDHRSGATGELANDVYRPLSVLSFSIDYALWKLNSFGYHLTNVLFHSANAILVFILFMLLSGNFLVSFFGSLLFASHPVQTEVVSWVSGRSSVLFLFFYLMSLIFYIKYSKEGKRPLYLFSILLFSAAIFSKEMAATLPAILLIYDIHFTEGIKFRAKLSRCVPYIIILTCYVFLRITLLKKVGQFDGWGNPLLTFMTMSNVLVDYIRILIFPIKLCAVGYPIPLVSSIGDVRFIFSIACIIAILASLPFFFKRHKIVSFAIFFFFITLLPVMNIIPIKALEAERFLYLPSIGFCLLTAYIFSVLGGKLTQPLTRRATVAIAIAVVILMGYSTRTILRNEDWKDEIVISRKTVEASPKSAWALMALGANLIERDKYAEAIPHLEKAVKLSRGYELARNALGECYLRVGRFQDAINEFEQIVELNPMAVNTRNMLGVAYANLKKYTEAEKQFKIALKKNPEFLNAHLNLGRLYELKGDYLNAVKQYFIILQYTYDPQDIAVAYVRVADAYLKMDLREKARAYYMRARRISGPEAYHLIQIVDEKLKAL